MELVTSASWMKLNVGSEQFRDLKYFVACEGIENHINTAGFERET
jgi:hypothetical protein